MNKQIAMVSAVHRDRYELQLRETTCYGRLKSAKFYKEGIMAEYPTVGDLVEIVYNPLGDSQITKVLPRKSVFKRLNATPGAPDLSLAANFDYVFLTMSLNQDFHLSKLERYVTVAWQSGGTPVVILTKADLCEDREFYVEQVRKEAPGVAIHCVSSVTGEGFEELAPYLAKGKVSVLMGASGVGKSSLTNVLLGEQKMQTGGIRETDDQGRHTTTHKQCLTMPDEIELPNGNVINGGGIIIDTPGIRKLIVSEVEEGLKTSFEDVEELVACCRFSDCRHEKEPGCAIRVALEDGTLSKVRWKTYLDMKREEEFSQERKQKIIKRMKKKTKKM